MKPRRDLGLFLAGGLVSSLGSWVSMTLIGYTVFDITGSAFLVGLQSWLTLGSMWIVAPKAGVIADRYDRRRILMAACGAMAVVAVAMALSYAVDPTQVWPLVFLSIPLGIGAAVATPASRALVPLLTTPEGVPQAMAWSLAKSNLGRVLGPLVAAWFLHSLHVGEGFLFNAGTFVVFAVVLANLHPAPQEPTAYTAPRIRTALTHIRSRPGLTLCFTSKALKSFLLGGATALLPAVAVQVSGWPGLLGVLSSLVGVGSVAGSLGGARLATKMERRHLVAGSVTVLALGGLTIANGIGLGSPIVTGVGCLVFGAGNFSANSVMSGAVAAMTPDRERGRILGLFTLTGAGIAPIGAVFWGAAADLASLGVVLTIAATATLGLAVAIMVVPAARSVTLGRAPARQ